jgi:hypothetical protein
VEEGKAWGRDNLLPALPAQEVRFHKGGLERTEFIDRAEDAMRGRKPRGPEFVRGLQGGAQERQRLEAILETVAGRLGIGEAAQQLQMTPQRLHMLREQALQAALDALAPQPLGRPQKSGESEQERIAALQRENERLQRELAATKLREEIAVVLPNRPRRDEKKRPADSAS